MDPLLIRNSLIPDMELPEGHPFKSGRAHFFFFFFFQIQSFRFNFFSRYRLKLFLLLISMSVTSRSQYMIIAPFVKAKCRVPAGR